MMSPEHDPEAWNAILVSEFAKLIVEGERLSAMEFIDNVKAGELEPLENDDEVWNTQN